RPVARACWPQSTTCRPAWPATCRPAMHPLGCAVGEAIQRCPLTSVEAALSRSGAGLGTGRQANTTDCGGIRVAAALAGPRTTIHRDHASLPRGSAVRLRSPPAEKLPAHQSAYDSAPLHRCATRTGCTVPGRDQSNALPAPLTTRPGAPLAGSAVWWQGRRTMLGTRGSGRWPPLSTLRGGCPLPTARNGDQTLN